MHYIHWRLLQEKQLNCAISLHNRLAYTCICSGMVESDGIRSSLELVLNLVLAPGDRIPMSSVLEEELVGAFDDGIWGTIRSVESIIPKVHGLQL